MRWPEYKSGDVVGAIQPRFDSKRDPDIDLSRKEHRCNPTTRGVPLNHLVGVRFRVGSVMLQGGRLHTPWRYLDLVTGKSVCDLLGHRSGLNWRIIEGGGISVGDIVRPV